MKQFLTGPPPPHSARPSAIDNSAFSPPSPLDEVIDLVGPASYADTFRVGSGSDHEHAVELRIGQPDDYVFARVKIGGMAIELSSGLCGHGARFEAWHGISSGQSVKGPLLLQCSLKFDGTIVKLDLRVKADRTGSDTLIYGSSRIACAALGPCARVSMRKLSEEEAAEGAVNCNGNGVPAMTPTAHGPAPVNGRGNGVAKIPAKRPESRVRFCESDHWYEYEAPALIPAVGSV